MKRWSCFLLSVCLLFAMTGCASQGVTSDPDSSPASPRPIAVTQTAEIQEYLNDTANNGFIAHNYYTSPEKIDLYYALYDGAGIGTVGITDWSEQEKQDVLTAAGWDEYHCPPLKVTRAAFEALVQEKTGLSAKDFERDITQSFHYIEAYDAYYAMHGDTNYDPITVISGETDGDGHYVIEYVSNNDAERRAIVTLRKGDVGYQFISNVEVEN